MSRCFVSFLLGLVVCSLPTALPRVTTLPEEPRLVEGMTAHGAARGEGALVVRLDPEMALTVRALAQPFPGVVLFAAGSSAEENQRVAVGLTWGSFVAGPVTLEGGLAELRNPLSGGPGSARSWTPTAIRLDTTLRPTTRRGVSWTPFPWVGAFGLLRDDRATAALLLRARVPETVRPVFAELVIARAFVGAPPDGHGSTTEPHPTDSSWFGNELYPGDATHGVLRAGGNLTWVAAGGAAGISVPDAGMPGFWSRGTVRFRPGAGMTVSGRAALLSPDFLRPDGRVPGTELHVGVRYAYDRSPLALSLQMDRTAAGHDARYRRPGLPAAALRVIADEYAARFRIRTRRWVGVLESVGITGSVDLPGATEELLAEDAALLRHGNAEVEWRAALECRMRIGSGVNPGGSRAVAPVLVELVPVLSMGEEDGPEARARATLSLGGPVLEWLAPAATLSVSARGTWRALGDSPVSGDGDLEWRVELRAGQAAPPTAPE